MLLLCQSIEPNVSTACAISHTERSQAEAAETRGWTVETATIGDSSDLGTGLDSYGDGQRNAEYACEILQGNATAADYPIMQFENEVVRSSSSAAEAQGFEIPASIITLTAAFTVNLRVQGSANISLLNVDRIFTLWIEPIRNQLETWFGETGVQIHRAVTASPMPIIIAAVMLLALRWFFATEIGLGLRATGANPEMSQSQGITTARYRIGGEVLFGSKARSMTIEENLALAERVLNLTNELVENEAVSAPSQPGFPGGDERT